MENHNRYFLHSTLTDTIYCKITIVLICFLLNSCANNKPDHSLFTVLNTEKTGIHFSNQLSPSPAFNLFSYMYYYNGAGIGSGDFNNDGLIDLFFTANQQPNALYLNMGKMHFEDVTQQAGISRDSLWSTGVSVVDINNDGLLDIYISRVGHYKVLIGKNQLLICTGIDSKGIPHYSDQAAAYGLDFSGFSTQAAFLDYDGDCDLDLFLLNHSVNHDGNYAPRSYFLNTYDSMAGQKFYRNDGKRFVDVTKTVGINGSKIGYGLGVAVSDIDLDGWPDIYVGNDFHENDYLYINQHDGTFKDKSTDQIMHTSQFSMGVDVADINNDAYPDIVSMDMLPYDPYMLRRSLSEDDYNIFQNKIAFGYTYQYARNNLQLNRRNNQFSEIGQYAGIQSTDWSWAALWMDFNNDGLKDLFVSNGIPKRMNDIDYINFVSGDEIQQKLKENAIQDRDLALLSKFPEIKIPNQFFLNRGDGKFDNFTDSIFTNPPSFSNGAIYADLDNDGDLDVVVNNINDPVMLYQNNTNNSNHANTIVNFASVQLKGLPDNINAIGAKIFLFNKSQISSYEMQSVHGFQSSMVAPIHIGLNNIKPDSVFLVWPDNRFEKIQLVEGKQISKTYKKGLPIFDYSILHPKITSQDFIAEDITNQTGLNYQHTENLFNEFDRESLIPHMNSTEGPALAVADINHDGLEDVFVGASKTFHNAIFIQNASGSFTRMKEPALELDSMWENVDAIWVDVNRDTHVDLIIANGGNEYYGEDEHLQPLLYLNDGKGHLTKSIHPFPPIYTTQKKVIANDFNHDGFVDVFIAGHVVPWQYGKKPRSFLLQNNGKGQFIDVTAKYAEELLEPGMVTDAKWIDINSDKEQDLLLCYEWGGVECFIKTAAGFTKKIISSKNGWWQMLYPADIDDDGDIDIVAGNYGLNSRLRATKEKPVKLYINDFDDNGSTEQVMTYYVNGKEIPFASKIQLEKKMPYLKKKFLYAADFAEASMSELFGKNKIDQSKKLSVECFENTVFINDGNMNFTANILPYPFQLSTFKAAATIQTFKNSARAIAMMGNFYANNVELGRQDADFGSILISNADKTFNFSTFNGITITGEVRKIERIIIGKRIAYILAKNNNALQIITFN